MRQTFIYGIIILISFGSNFCSVDKNNPVVGNWSFLITNGFNCYSCPKIEFNNDGKGNFIRSSKEKIEFTYEILPSNKIKFIFEKKGYEGFFKQSEIFYYQISSVDNFKHIDLLDVNDKEIVHSLISKTK